MKDALLIQKLLSETFGADYDIDHWTHDSHGQSQLAHTFITGRQYIDQIKHLRVSFDNTGLTVSMRILTTTDCREIRSIVILYDDPGFLTQLMQVFDDYLPLLS